MNVRDIVHRERVNLTNCESEPIHIPGAIQPHGFLLGLLAGPEYRLVYCSGNSADYTGFGFDQLLGKSFDAAFGQNEAATLVAYLDSEEYRTGNPVALTLGGVAYSCTLHLVGGILVLEAEPFPDGFRNLPDLYLQTRRFVTAMEQTQTLRELCQSVAAETRRITGYDRVMVYRFDEEYNGEVIAEAVRDDLEPFLHLHYPHTDIPAQARALYLRNLLRMIVDVGYVPVPIYTIDEGPKEPLDLSQSVLRSVSPIHIEYLRNMGVGATMSISLVHNKRLWGLIACHHYGPRNIPHYTRLSAQLQGHFLTSQIGVRETSEAFEAGKLVTAALDELLPAMTGLDESGIAALMQRPEVLRLAHADGVALCFKGNLYRQGAVPAAADLRRLAITLHAQSGAGTFVTDRLRSPGDTPLRQLPGTAAGAVYHSLAGDGDDFILWLRQDRQEQVIWAGDPSKAMVKDEKGLSPRKSFEQWKGLKAGSSRPWSEAELAATSNFAYSLQKGISIILLASEEQRYRLLSEQLQQANSELENINWISTHDLQEPLRKIQVFSSRLSSKLREYQVNAVVLHDMERMNDAATRMQSLVNDIHSYSKFNHQELDLVPVKLDRVLDEVLLDLREELAEGRLQLRRSPLPEINGEPFLLRQLFTNLIRNAVKFHREDEAVSVRIDYKMVDGAEQLDVTRCYHEVIISDDGIGFSNEFAETIFGIFKRLHSQAEYRGTGIGLAICRKIMQRHNGHISAKGEEGIGAQFYLHFPVD